MASNYFTNETIEFLEELAANNNRDWFSQNKARYEQQVLEPSLRLIETCGKLISGVAPMLRCEAKRQGGSLMRIYRDTRFSKNKDPYKPNIGIQFRHEAGKDIHAPGFYIHVQPDECFVAAGIWHPEPAVLKQLRQGILDDSKQWLSILKERAFAKTYELAGESLKRPPQGFQADHECIDDLRRKDFIGVAKLSSEQIIDPGLPKLVTKQLKIAGPFMQFLCSSLGLVY